MWFCGDSNGENFLALHFFFFGEMAIWCSSYGCKSCDLWGQSWREFSCCFALVWRYGRLNYLEDYDIFLAHIHGKVVLILWLKLHSFIFRPQPKTFRSLIEINTILKSPDGDWMFLQERQLLSFSGNCALRKEQIYTAIFHWGLGKLLTFMWVTKFNKCKECTSDYSKYYRKN